MEVTTEQGNEIQTEMQEAQKGQEEQEGAKGQITLGEDGELNIPDSFWQGTESLDPEASQDEAQEVTETPPLEAEPAKYTPEELAEAFHSGDIDEKRLPAELVGYYKAITEAAKKRSGKNAILDLLPAQQPQPQVQPQQIPQAATPPVMGQGVSPLAWVELQKLGREVAARNYLGIDPKDFDEFNQQHMAAQQFAVNEIREQARMMQQQQQEQQQRGQQQVTARWNAVNELGEQLRQSDPQLKELDWEKFLPQWCEKLTRREYDAVTAIMMQGDLPTVKKLIEKIGADYKASKTPVKKEVTTPPRVMEAKGGNVEEQAGMVDIKDFGDMTEDEQVNFLLKNKWADM